MKYFYMYFLILFVTIGSMEAQVLVEAEGFDNKGGWTIDPQFMDQMGSPYLMAHGAGVPVANAKTNIEFSDLGKYKIWVRTFNWVSPWYEDNDGPGAFKLSVNGEIIPRVLGTKGTQWMWQEAGKIDIKNRSVDIELIDLTGFNGRIDAILFTKDIYFVPPNDIDKIDSLRESLNPRKIHNEGKFDLVVIGGGTAGASAALSAARLGLKVALINNRPMLGGNNSSEVRVGLSGKINQNYYPKLGNALRELTGIPIPEDSHKEISGLMHPPRREASTALDDFRSMIFYSEPNASLYLNIHVNKVEMDGNSIISVSGENVETGEIYKFTGSYFADCTGDATVGFLAGADYRVGRESHYEAFEPKAPSFSDNHTLGTTLMWRSERTKTESDFPILPWAAKLTDEYHLDNHGGGWKWESGHKKDIIEDAEYVRDNILRAIFGNWSYLKNNKEKYRTYKLSRVPFIGGKRESRRLLGDIILNENDIVNQVDYPDKSFTTTWSIDLHYEDEKNSKYFPGTEWQAYAIQTELEAPYHVPYRTLYSRNINNLFMAGRNISVTHVALGTVRVMTTTAMMGEVVGMAAKVCHENNALPRDVYEKYLSELQHLMSIGFPTKVWDIHSLPHERPYGLKD